MDINGKCIVLTGTASGIGKSLLEHLLQYNVKVIAVDKEEQPWLFSHPKVIPYQCDISKKKNIDMLFEFAVNKLGVVDIFIGNAGFGYYEKIVIEDWERIEKIFHTNVFASIYAAEKMYALNKDRRYMIAFTASTMVEFPIPGYALYAATKCALDGFIRTYRYEMGNKGKILMIYPISTKTQFFQTAGNTRPLEWPLQTPDKVAKAIIKGIQREKACIYPSKIYSLGKIISAVIPLVPKLYMKREIMKLEKWHKSSLHPYN
ncbi:SDR family NAD(P)-dependent oxidoreductase [Alkaliphilus pronyensis]|uniref:SDR family NAD(P)-dependent oxidoreductase n=1 Tax=Alkaliphilus pronyensis TaxID=1482732 RepID=A0A6I0FB87_9FIRM|nr:SDR family NAD(P)-dependent oxidoreductase [Alkaliphilus pronyensis]KAB3536033.1 SDR family NAD(P)-dependent oxidoreductase [Alkaliphilus pronyensis]